MKDLFEKLIVEKTPLGQFAPVEGYYIFPKLEGELSSRMIFNGEEVIVWSLNNYLGLANHPEVRETDAQAAKDWGLAYPMGARAMTGATDYHDKLEKELASFVKKEKALLLNYGYQGMVSIIQSLVSRHDVIVYDSESHACILDGLQLHFGQRFVYKHNDIADLEKNLGRAAKLVENTSGGILVITEGVFGMSGDQGKLKEICALKDKYKFRLLVDDAHGFGGLGATGAGAGEEQGVQDDIDLYFSTFAKSMASIGAFVAGDERVVKFLKYNLRSQIFAKSLPMALVIGNLKRLELLRTKPELKEKLWHNVRTLQNGLKERGFDIGKTNSCVTPVYMHVPVEISSQVIFDLRATYKIFCSAVVYPVVPKGTLLLRLIPTATHTEKDINDTLDAFEAVAGKLKRGEYAQEFVKIEA
jgi:glycine C-acetyltransferase